jgi:CubicO group peptidase (beta-lactamase class C family)
LFTALVTALAFVMSDGLPVKSPKSVGMSAERLESIDRVVRRGIKAGGYPGAAVVVGRQGAAVYQKGFGALSWGSEAPAVTSDRTIYDLASLSKVIGTTTAIMVLYDEGRVDLDAPVVTYLPAFAGGAKDRVTVRQLLTHRSGLPAGRDLWRIAYSPDQAKAAVLATPLECAPGACFIYSDIGADVLGMIAETVSGQSLDRLLDERVFGPLGMNDTFYRPADSLLYRVAPTELVSPRGYALRGQVHDENAHALGGVAGHAGLFSTAADLSVFAQMMLNGGSFNGVRILSDSAVSLFTRRAAGTRALGWDTCSGEGGCGQFLTGRAYGHTGFTGTSIWIDPDREMFVILLTNRVHAARARRPAKVIADVRADLADAAAAAVMDDPSNILAMPVAFRADRAIGWNTVERPHRSRSAKRGKSARSRAAAAARRGSAKKSKAAKSSSASRRRTAAAHNRTTKASAAKAKAGKGKSVASRNKSAVKHRSPATKTKVSAAKKRSTKAAAKPTKASAKKKRR